MSLTFCLKPTLLIPVVLDTGASLTIVATDIMAQLRLSTRPTQHLRATGSSQVAASITRNVTAKIANLREVKWESLALNFVLVFSPNTLVGAPHNLLVTVTLPKDVPLATEAKLAQQIGRAFPASTAIRVKDAIDAFNVIFSRVMIAVRAAGSVTLLAGALVLAGALATAQRRRIQQAVILRRSAPPAAASCFHIWPSIWCWRS